MLVSFWSSLCLQNFFIITARKDVRSRLQVDLLCYFPDAKLWTNETEKKGYFSVSPSKSEPLVMFWSKTVFQEGESKHLVWKPFDYIFICHRWTQQNSRIIGYWSSLLYISCKFHLVRNTSATVDTVDTWFLQLRLVQKLRFLQHVAADSISFSLFWKGPTVIFFPNSIFARLSDWLVLR